MPRDLISVDDARSRVLAAVRGLPAEAVAAGDAAGRVLAEDVLAQLELPPFDSSAMDGFALVAGPAGELRVVGESRAGTPYDGQVDPGLAVRISTGAVIPGGADAVVPVERVEERADTVLVPDVPEGANVRRAGDDVRPGEMVIPAGSELGPAELGMLAALGQVEARCARRPRLAVLATGDELVPPGQPLGPGQIHDSNAVAIGALARRAGAEPVGRFKAGDTHAATVAALEEALAAADVLCISGGVSVGPHDHVRPALQEIGFEQLLWGVRLKPGKPFWFGVRDAAGADARQYAFGLPGNPVSALVTFQLFARSALRALQGANPAAMRSTAVLDGPIGANSDRDQAVRCRLRMADDGWHADPTGAQGSHVLSSMIGAGALAIVPAGERDLAPGERVLIEVL
jgi:molybdopterin molybdotransferase